MKGLRDMSIRHKLTLISMLVSGAALLVASATFVALEVQRFRDQLVTDLQSTAEVLAYNSLAAITFDYAGSAEVTLRSLSAKPHVEGAVIYKDGRVFASYARAPSAFVPPPLMPDGARYGAHALDVFYPVISEGERVGTIFIRSDLAELHQRMRSYMALNAGVLAVAFVIAFLLARRLQGIIAGPVAQLAATAAAVGAQKNYALRAVKHGNDELGGLIDGFNDMLSQIEQRERALAVAGTELERRNAELVQKNVELQRALQTKDVFLANMSHELRTPLNAIIGFTGTLLMKLPGALNPQQEEQLGIVQSSARRLLAMVNDLLDLAKIESGKVRLVAERLSCRELVEHVAAGVAAEAAAKGLALEVVPPAEDVRILADRRAVTQILGNLCDNAVKFTDAGSIVVAARLVDEGGVPAVEFSVTDTGAGVPPQFQDKLFEAFAQMDSTHREGTGLGLHLSRKLAQLIDGRMRFESEYGRGSRFSLTLPVE